MLEAGDVFGEMALVLDQPRAATVEAMTDLEIFEIDRELLRSIFQEYPQLGDVFSRLIKRRLVENVMATAPIFAGLDQEARTELMNGFEVREAKEGTRLVEAGTRPDGLYLLLAGEVSARTKEGEVALLRPGQLLGAAGLIDPTYKSQHTLESMSDTLALRLPRTAFNEVICTYPPVLEHLSQIADEQAAWNEVEEVPVV
jgi:CRP-like cAMP-binding protein